MSALKTLEADHTWQLVTIQTASEMKLFQVLPFSLSTLSSAGRKSSLLLIRRKSKGKILKIFGPLGVLL